MDQDIVTKHCVGVFIYNREGKIYMMRSPKWRNRETREFGDVWIIPGGRIEGNETFEEAVRREIREELHIELEKIEYIGHNHKPPSEDFFKPNVHFEFEDFIAFAPDSNIQEDTREIVVDDEEKWFTLEQVEGLTMTDATQGFFHQVKDLLRQRITEVQSGSTI